MTPLAAELAARIRADGPMTLADYMDACLTDPVHGYYPTRDPFGLRGDFVTAPEVSQMFGELIGLAIAQSWLDAGAPDPFVLGELGPGRGTLMADALRATRSVPGFHKAMRLWLVEISPVLRERQAEALASYNPNWCAKAQDLPDEPLFLIANEYFDALPIRQFRRTADGWAERRVGGSATLGLIDAEPTDLVPEGRLEEATEGQIVEVCPAATKLTGWIADRIVQSGGIALIVDYGDWDSLGDTFQAIYHGKPDDPFAHPGHADLTAHVDFAALAHAADVAGAAFTRLTPQGTYLTRLGLTQRAEALSRGKPEETARSIKAAYARLTDGSEMGSIFKVMAIHPKDSPLPPGFAP